MAGDRRRRDDYPEILPLLPRQLGGDDRYIINTCPHRIITASQALDPSVNHFHLSLVHIFNGLVSTRPRGFHFFFCHHRLDNFPRESRVGSGGNIANYITTVVKQLLTQHSKPFQHFHRSEQWSSVLCCAGERSEEGECLMCVRRTISRNCWNVSKCHRLNTGQYVIKNTDTEH